jgi:hypothetical protein
MTKMPPQKSILIRVPLDVAEAIEKIARANDRSVNQELRRRIVKEFAPRSAKKE